MKILPRTVRKVISSYRKVVKRSFNGDNLLYTNVLISIGISTLGDSMEQSFEIYKKELDGYEYDRTTQMAFSGCTAGIIGHYWYINLDRIIVGRTFNMVIKKLLLDQFICSPVIILSFFATVALFEENPVKNFTEEVQSKFWILYKAEWVVWPPAQIINFYFLPTRYRVLYDNCISLGYDAYTSHIKHQKPEKYECLKEEGL